MRPVSLLDVATYMPPREVGREYFEQYARPDDPLLRNPMFRAPRSRRYAERSETAADLIAAAADKLFADRSVPRPDTIDVVLTYTALPDVPFLGAGAEIARRLNCRPSRVVDLHNGHCAVFPYMLDMAATLISSGQAETALLCVAQNAGKIFTQPNVRQSAHASVIGDGAAVAIVGASDTSPILATEIRHYPEYAQDVTISLPDGRLYWEPGTSEMDVAFDNHKAQNIIERGSALVPDAIRRVCERVETKTSDIDLLVTNQPNRLLLRNWAKALDIAPERHVDTFDSYGNLFGAGIPVTFDQAVRQRHVADGSVVVFGAFAGAGEMAAAAAVHWRPDSERKGNGA